MYCLGQSLFKPVSDNNNVCSKPLPHAGLIDIVTLDGEVRHEPNIYSYILIFSMPILEKYFNIAI